MTKPRLSRLLRTPPDSLILAVSNFGDVLLPLIRGVCLAHLLSPTEFGLAITVSVVAGIVELVTDLGVAQMAIRSESRHEIGVLHTVALLRGLAIGVAVALLGPVFSLVFHSPATAGVYTVVGLASVIKGFTHLDIKVRMRDYDYKAEAVTGMVSQVAWTVLSVALAAVLHDFRAMAYGLIGYAACYVAVSHCFRESPWRLGWDRAVIWASVRYGRPLALNGLLYSFVNLGDRTLTGARIGLEQLAHYTALSTSAFLPRSAVGKFLTSIFISHFVNARTAEAKRHAANLWVLTLMIISGMFGIGYVAFGQIATALVFGKAYHVGQEIVCLVALLGTIRYLSCLPSPPALALARNDLLLRFTLLSASGIALGGVLVFLWAPRLELMLTGMIIGESVGMLWCIWMMIRLTGADPIHGWLLFVIPIGETVIAAFASVTVVVPTVEARLVGFFIGLAAHAAVSLLCMRAIGCRWPDVARIVFPSRKLAGSV